MKGASGRWWQGAAPEGALGRAGTGPQEDSAPTVLKRGQGGGTAPNTVSGVKSRAFHWNIKEKQGLND